jgi:hypothetical protein
VTITSAHGDDPGKPGRHVGLAIGIVPPADDLPVALEGAGVIVARI